MAKKIDGELVERVIQSREGVVYITAKHVYKVFGRRTNPYEELTKYKAAEAKGVPVPDTAKFTAQLQDGMTIESIGGLRSTRAFGRFFQLSNPGGEKALINEINSMKNRELLKIIITGLTNASQLGVTDPQGFINISSSPTLTFIDLHYRGVPNLITFQAVLQAAKAKLQQLG